MFLESTLMVLDYTRLPQSRHFCPNRIIDLILRQLSMQFQAGDFSGGITEEKESQKS